VRDLQEIRFQNFGFLVQELEDELGKPRGVMARLAILSGVKPSLLSMLSKGALHSETGKRRQIGDDTARKLEAGMGKEQNWLDVDRADARDHKEAAALDRWRQLSDSQKEAIIRMMDEFSGAPTQASPPKTDAQALRAQL
jgi:hypothetical protein